MTTKRPIDFPHEGSSDPRIVSPLSQFAGAVPPAPAWFHKALADTPERSFIEVEGAKVEVLTWGERGKPGLLLLHGNGAHADWYSFIAPFFSKQYRVAAMSWTGMGGSDWREAYEFDQYGREAMAVAEATGLFEAAVPPVVAAHSFGGALALRLAAVSGDRLKGVILLDNVPRPPELRWQGPPSSEGRKPRIHPDLTAGLARFRLMPPQPCDNLFVLDYIARLALRPSEDGTGLVWRHDPQLWPKMDRQLALESEKDLQAARCPLAFIWGEHSQLVPDVAIGFTRRYVPEGTPMLAVPDADHHLMLDQPLATVAALRGLLAAWPS
jgi:pimeloyl-ACP methyl ester carboxylesterase